jgi:hypothetical protein
MAHSLSNGQSVHVFDGPWLWLNSRKSWNFPAALTEQDRRLIIRAVDRGDAITDLRLAPGVIGYCAAVRRGVAKEQRRLRWELPLLAIGPLLGVVASLISGDAALAALFVIVLMSLAGSALWAPRGRARALRNADAAESLATAALQSASTGATDPSSL